MLCLLSCAVFQLSITEGMHLAVFGGRIGDVEGRQIDGDIMGKLHNATYKFFAKGCPKLTNQTNDPNIEMGVQKKRDQCQILIK